jgi:hypothetical protein
LTRIPAVTLGWFDASPDAKSKDVALRQIEGINLSTTLSLIRFHGEQRPAAAMVWEMTKLPPTGEEDDAPAPSPARHQCRRMMFPGFWQ